MRGRTTVWPWHLERAGQQEVQFLCQKTFVLATGQLWGWSVKDAVDVKEEQKLSWKHCVLWNSVSVHYFVLFLFICLGIFSFIVKYFLFRKLYLCISVWCMVMYNKFTGAGSKKSNITAIVFATAQLFQDQIRPIWIQFQNYSKLSKYLYT